MHVSYCDCLTIAVFRLLVGAFKQVDDIVFGCFLEGFDGGFLINNIGSKVGSNFLDYALEGTVLDEELRCRLHLFNFAQRNCATLESVLLAGLCDWRSCLGFRLDGLGDDRDMNRDRSLCFVRRHSATRWLLDSQTVFHDHRRIYVYLFFYK